MEKINITEASEKILVAYYHWGEYERDEEISPVVLPLTKLDKNQIAGFNIREEDKDKVFYASDNDIDSDQEGTSVKHSYAIIENSYKAANGKTISLDDTLESIKGYDFRNQVNYVFSVGMPVKWIQAGRALSGKIIAIRRPKVADNDKTQWTVHVKSDVSGVTLYTKVYFLLNNYNKAARNSKLPYDIKNSERLELIKKLMIEGERINHQDDVLDMRADLADVDENTSEEKQFWVINSLIDFVQHSPMIDYYVEKAKSLGWADQYAANGKSIEEKGKWMKLSSYSDDKAANGKRVPSGEEPGSADGKMRYKLGDEWSQSFDYGGMFQKVLETNVDWSIKDLKKLKNSMVDVNYHTLAHVLIAATSELETGNTERAQEIFNNLHEAMREEMVEQYVDIYLDEDMPFILNKVGQEELLKMDGIDREQKAREVAMEYFLKNPEQMTDKSGSIHKFAKGGKIPKHTENDFEKTRNIKIGQKEYKIRISYNAEYDSTNINITDYTQPFKDGYTWSIEHMPLEVINAMVNGIQSLNANVSVSDKKH